MRLLNAHTLELKPFIDSIPPYAILSHCWEDEEVIFSDLSDLEQARKKKGFAKIEKTCELAIGDGFNYVWIDTCCIDKSSSAELSEAINSMFAWYRDSKQCYAYLADVEHEGAFAEGYLARDGIAFSRSRWFARAWTLQELLAPSSFQHREDSPRVYHSPVPIKAPPGRYDGMKFYSRDWQLLGSKPILCTKISMITGIPRGYLEGQSLETASISMRMSWAAGRQATRPEDIAYSLLGVFDVNIPLLYGEGDIKAFRRLQEEIMKISEDETLFAWQASHRMNKLAGDALASGPNDFRATRSLIPFASDDPVPPSTMTHRGLRIWQTLFHTHQLDSHRRSAIRPLHGHMMWPDRDVVWGILRCHVAHDFQHFVIVPLVQLSADIYHREVSYPVSLVPFEFVPSSAFPKEIYIRYASTSTVQNSFQRRWGFLIRKPSEGIEVRRCLPKEAWNEKDSILQGKDNHIAPFAWTASLELRFGLVNKAGWANKYTIFLSLGCLQDAPEEKPQPWYDIKDAVWEQGSMILEAFHTSASPKPVQNESGRVRIDYVVGTDVSFKVFITPTKVLSQDMFVVDFHYAELPDNSGET
ncbi:uncharacterized protein J4E92_004603 [Alternaria infectoria]|uniref:uncharacterized protein n=1 Tax=Alternaria infectoria TaxID=45303 RepID=UPI0022202366|nr:uncharacterized protein J4E92_004603 [Alternaria infectoria]KAI4930771.1 hypothetical protein J4E92_004603 [Alternaria infectoria]